MEVVAISLQEPGCQQERLEHWHLVEGEGGRFLALVIDLDCPGTDARAFARLEGIDDGCWGRPRW